VAMTCGLLPMLLLPWRFGWAVLVVALLVAVLGNWYRHRIGGYTGDCLGAAQQVSEVGFYLTAVALT
jgi:adenosylcobinamide-GDP ribazoletransferase